MPEAIYRRVNRTVQAAMILPGALALRFEENSNKRLYFAQPDDLIAINLRFQVIEFVGVGCAGKDGYFVVGLERGQDFFFGVGKVQHKGVFFALVDAVEA